MARFLIGTIPVVGHVNPAMPIACKLVERGHEVWWYTGQAFQPKALRYWNNWQQLNSQCMRI